MACCVANRQRCWLSLVFQEGHPLPGSPQAAQWRWGVVWRYRKIALNQHRQEGDEVELLCDAGEERWELVSTTSPI
jgi:hypothetical protein